MHIFNNLKGPEYYAAQRRSAHRQYLQKRGITEEEYQLELEEKARKEHQEYLDRLGITEEEFQRRINKEERKRKNKDSLYKYATISALLGGIILFILGAVSEDFRDALKPIVLAFGGVWLLFIFIMLCTPVFLIINSFFKHLKLKKYIRIILTIVLTIFVLVLIWLLLNTFYSGGGSDYYEPGKLRPDKF